MEKIIKINFSQPIFFIRKFYVRILLAFLLTYVVLSIPLYSMQRVNQEKQIAVLEIKSKYAFEIFDEILFKFKANYIEKNADFNKRLKLTCGDRYSISSFVFNNVRTFTAFEIKSLNGGDVCSNTFLTIINEIQSKLIKIKIDQLEIKKRDLISKIDLKKSQIKSLGNNLEIDKFILSMQVLNLSNDINDIESNINDYKNIQPLYFEYDVDQIEINHGFKYRFYYLFLLCVIIYGSIVLVFSFFYTMRKDS